MNIVLDIALSGLGMVNSFLHILGFYILLRRYKKSTKNPQKIYILNLSIFEIILNLLGNLARVPEMLTHSKEVTKVITFVQHYATLFNLTGAWIITYLTMIYITIDRFLVVYLGFRYSLYWTKRKALYVVNLTWACCALFSISIAVGEFFLHFHYQDVFYKYFYPTMDFLYLVIVISVYVYIFYRYQKSFKLQHKVSKRTLNKRNASTAQEAFYQSRFYTSILLVFTFLFFIVIPDLTYMFFGPKSANRSHDERSHGYESNLLFDICRFSYGIASSLNFFIYIFLQPDVRRILVAGSQKVGTFLSRKKIENYIKKKREERKKKRNFEHLNIPLYELEMLNVDVDVIRNVEG